MPFTVIAISRAIGAGGEDLGSSVASALGFRYVDNEIINRASELAGATVAEVSRVEARKGLMTRILENLARANAGAMPAAGVPDMAALYENPTPIYEQLIVDVIRETAAEGNVVIVAHGASIPLAGTQGLLRVLVTASKEIRGARVARTSGLTFERAEKQVEDSDRGRADYFRRFYNVDREEATHYDLVVNTDIVSIDQATQLILLLAKS